uniref:Uncharacterized protein n=1 Tax=Vespula pensylvanica TaxID=30213 RepID=A0A834UA28_VESPE|nr:hypothetical protein H0235_007746 [Vespula pensylvanica]
MGQRPVRVGYLRSIDDGVLVGGRKTEDDGSKCCNGATELTAPRYTVIVQWLTYRLRIAPGLQVPFGGITDSQHPPADASAEIDGKTETSRKVSSRFLDPIDIERSLESNLTRFGPTTNRKIC